MSKSFKIVGNDMSDGYHTFDELYDHRCLLFLNMCLDRPRLCCWRPDFEGWFCLYRNGPEGQISYHLPNRLLPLVEGQIERNDSVKFDGHNSNDVLERLAKMAKAFR
jgi:hypothetical protein